MFRLGLCHRGSANGKGDVAPLEALVYFRGTSVVVWNASRVFAKSNLGALAPWDPSLYHLLLRAGPPQQRHELAFCRIDVEIPQFQYQRLGRHSSCTGSTLKHKADPKARTGTVTQQQMVASRTGSSAALIVPGCVRSLSVLFSLIHTRDSCIPLLASIVMYQKAGIDWSNHGLFSLPLLTVKFSRDAPLPLTPAFLRLEPGCDPMPVPGPVICRVWLVLAERLTRLLHFPPAVSNTS